MGKPEIPLELALRLTLARQHLAKGASLTEAAEACGMDRAELDLALWRWPVVRK